METWHRRLGHRTLNKAAVQYISSHVRQMDILPEREAEDQICDICAKGRQHKESATGTREKAQEILEVVHSDICGPMQVTTLNGQRYFITFIDEMSGRVGIALLHRKSDAMTVVNLLNTSRIMETPLIFITSCHPGVTKIDRQLNTGLERFPELGISECLDRLLGYTFRRSTDKSIGSCD